LTEEKGYIYVDAGKVGRVPPWKPSPHHTIAADPSFLPLVFIGRLKNPAWSEIFS